MINPFRDINWHPGFTELRTFARSFMIGFPVLSVAFALGGRWWSQIWPSWTLWLGIGGALVGGLCWISPLLARPLYFVWSAVSAGIGLVVSNALLALIYYFLLTPIGLLLRLCGRDALRQRWNRSASSYWISSRPSTGSRDYFRQS